MARKNFHDLWLNEPYNLQLPVIFEDYIEMRMKEELDHFFDGEKVDQDIYDAKKKLIEKKLKTQSKEFIYLEMLFYFHHETFYQRGQFFEKDPFSMFSNHEEKIYQGVSYINSFYKKTVFLMKNIYSKDEIKFNLVRYFAIPSAYRLFEKTGNTISINPHVKFKKTYRENLYTTILNDPSVIEHAITGNEKDIIGKDQREDQILIWKEIEGNKQKELVRTTVKKIFPGHSYKEHKTILFPMTELMEQRKIHKKGSKGLRNTKVTAKDYKEMDNIHYKGWEERYKDLSIQEIDPNLGLMPTNTSFKFQDVNYVLGPLGSGKSTLSMGIIYRLVQEGKKIFIPVADTQLGFDLKEELREIGIENVAIFTGRKSIQSHRDNFIQNNAKKYKNAFEFMTKRKNDLDILDDTCYIRGKIEYPEKYAHPCSRLTVEKKGGKKEIFCCPMYDACGANRMYQEMVKADVWIGSYEAFLKSRAPYQWDKYERTFYELAILWSDLVVVDEVDIAQVRFDDAFKETLPLVVDKNKNRADNFFIDYLITTESKADKNQEIDKSLYVYGKAITTAHEVSRYMFTHVLNKPHFFRKLAQQTFTPYQLLYQWLETYTVQSTTGPISPKLLNALQKEFTYDVPTYSSNAESIRTKLEVTHSDEEKAEDEQNHINGIINNYIDKLFTSLGVTVHNVTDKQMLKRNRIFEFILFFWKFEDLIQHLRIYFQQYTEKTKLKDDEKFKLDFIFPRNAHTLYVSDPLTRNIYAYKLFYDRDKMQLEQIYYYGVGRNLMYKMHESFTDIEPHEKPAMLFLSATSYSPESSRFHLQIKPNWLIKSKRQANQKLNCHLSFFVEDNTVLTISGESDENKRRDNIRKIAKGMVNKSFLDGLILELDQKRQTEQLTLAQQLKANPTKEAREEFKAFQQERRGVIGVATSSFKNAEVFTQGLVDAGFPKERIKTLYSPDKGIERKPHHISKNEVYDLYKEDIDVFVFVWKSIDRGFNILRGENSKKSLLSKIIFLNRPHPIPGDFSESIMFLHGYQTQIDDSITKKGQMHSEALSTVHRLANWKIKDVFSKRIAWSALEDDDRLIYGYNEFIPIGQTKGRGFRGGTDLDVYYVDGKFAEKTAETNSWTFIDDVETSILAAWKEVLDSSHDSLKRELYGVFEDGLKNIKVDYY